MLAVDVMTRSYLVYGSGFIDDLHARARLDLSYKVIKWVEVFAGASYNYYLDLINNDLASKNAADYVVKNHHFNRTASQFEYFHWVGYQAGIRIGK